MDQPLRRTVVWLRGRPRWLKVTIWVALDFYTAYGAPDYLYPDHFGETEGALLGAMLVGLLAPADVYARPTSSFDARTFATVSAAGYLACFLWYVVLHVSGHTPHQASVWFVMIMIQVTAVTSRFDAKAILNSMHRAPSGQSADPPDDPAA